MPEDEWSPIGNVEILIEEDGWHTFDIENLAYRAFNAALCVANISRQPYEISLLACNDARIRELNAQFRNRNEPTNVLAWPAGEYVSTNEKSSDDEAKFLGDIAIAWETFQKEANLHDKPLSDHFCHLIIHGCLHLLGYRHNLDIFAQEMIKIEIKALDLLDISNPYGEV